MAGRNAKPVSLHLAEGNPNKLTKAEIARREKANIKLGSDKLTCPAYVLHDTVAYKKWRELMHDYNKAKGEGIELVKSSDAGILARYCKTFSEYLSLLECRDKISRIDIDYEEASTINEALEMRFGTQGAAKLFAKIEYIYSVAGLLNIEIAINKKGDILTKLEDRLFLNPLAKIKNIPKKEAPKADPLKERGFGNV
jgi:phage terminase small subunit